MSTSPTLEQLGQLIKRAQYRHHRALDVQLGAFGITLVQWNALREIERHPGSSLHRLAELTFNSDQAFGMLAGRLLKLGWIRREQGVGRAVIHTLTAKGRKLLEQGRAAPEKVSTQSFSALDEAQRATLFDLLTRMLAVEMPAEGEADEEGDEGEGAGSA